MLHLRCKIIDILFFIIPLDFWRDFLIRRHYEKCPKCREKLVSVQEAQELLVQEIESESLPGFWPKLENRIAKDERGSRAQFNPWRNRSYRTAGVLATVIAAVWFFLVLGPNKPSDPEEIFRINYIKIGEEHARAYLFQPQDTDTIFVWAEKKTGGE